MVANRALGCDAYFHLPEESQLPCVNVCFGSLADIIQRQRHVRFTPIADIRRCRWDVRKVAEADILLGI